MTRTLLARVSALETVVGLRNPIPEKNTGSRFLETTNLFHFKGKGKRGQEIGACVLEEGMRDKDTSAMLSSCYPSRIEMYREDNRF